MEVGIGAFKANPLQKCAHHPLHIMMQGMIKREQLEELSLPIIEKFKGLLEQVCRHRRRICL